MTSKGKGPVFRISGLRASRSDNDLRNELTATITSNLSEEEKAGPSFTATIVPSCYDDAGERVGLVEFHGGVPDFLSKLREDPLEEWPIEMGNMDINFDKHFHGFTQLYTLKSDKPVTADIVAITGLDGHAYGSWRGRRNLGRMWLRDFLVEDLPYCRMMTYGYNSKLSNHGVETMMDFGRQLMEELKKIRNTNKLRQRPLFFIAHSFGGLILAHCLVKAVQTNEDDHPTIAALHRATYGMLLFGIPHRGLIVDDIQRMLAGQGNHPRNGVLEQIRSNSDLLAFQLADFRNLIRDRKLVSFYETQQTRQLEFDDEDRCWKRTGDFVTAVSSDSVLLQLPDFIEDKIPLDSDHSMMVKFDTRSARGYTSALRKLKEFERDALKVVDERFRNSRSIPLLSAAQKGHNKVVELLNTKDNSAIATKNPKTLLYVACKHGHLEIVKQLLEDGANITTLTDSGWTPSHEASRGGHLEVIKLLLEKGANITAGDNIGWTPLHEASLRGHLLVGKLLLERGAIATVADKNGWTTLHEAASRGHLEIVKLLLEKGADITAKHFRGWTPLFGACIDGRLEVVKLLLEKGADIAAVSREGHTPLHKASQHGQLEVVKLLLEKGANITAGDNIGWTPLHEASLRGHLLVVKLFLERVAIATVADKYGWTPLHEASSRGHLEIVKLLLEKGADITAKHFRAWTPLFGACIDGRLEVVKLLLEKGADIAAVSKEGHTPLHKASQHGHLEVVKLLADHGS